jgi:hypothetical protein
MKLGMKLRAIAVVTALFSAGSAYAHQAMELEGIVTNRTTNTFDVKTVKGETYTVFTTGVTKVVIGSRRMEFDSLKVGQAVVATGFGDALYSLTALQIRVTQNSKPAK